MSSAPVITVDGPAASGKGSIAQQVAAALGFHYLDSGKLYRAVALACRQQGIDGSDSAALGKTADTLIIDLTNNLDKLAALQEQPDLISPPTGKLASTLAANPALRTQLLPLQRATRRPPGLVADGRDMGTVVFPDATLPIFLTADLATRAERRHKQLKNRGIYDTIEDVYADLQQRDKQDSERAVAPLTIPADALVIDSTNQSIDDITDTILRTYRNRVSY